MSIGYSKKSEHRMIAARMPDILAVIRDEMGRRKMTVYQLVKLLKGKRANGKDIPSSTVYEFVKNGRNIGLDDLGTILDALQISVEVKRKAAKR